MVQEPDSSSTASLHSVSGCVRTMARNNYSEGLRRLGVDLSGLSQLRPEDGTDGHDTRWLSVGDNPATAPFAVGDEAPPVTTRLTILRPRGWSNSHGRRRRRLHWLAAAHLDG